ncbi:hypothetical protein GCM10007424_24110 [Flavobacterium suaedae]|uniref:Wadjet protein JetD C-terminal domain-containing protein n=1 Tax=Flavobacterium suaedae TaxID=1767027 RepID=A0ABQ1K3Z2_9FLAO|nr:hypothetical protein [Flavobacterium suaedae]GGB83250.1 hypothetical protein GCM10007424_24110 [Flavobacterium suaedae]
MNWIELRALNNLYSNGEVKINDTLAKSGEINYLINSLRILDRTHNKLFVLEGFAEIYEKDYLEEYHRYEAFLSDNKLLKPQLRFEESDIQILIGIKEDMDNGNLEPLREQIIKNEATVRIVSLMFFKNEKYLIGKDALINAVKLLLDIDELADDKDLQYKYVLECVNPKCIVLCENIDFLKRPTLARANNIELWYAGGKNVNKLDFVDTRGLTIYYSCDWDYDGLYIIYPLVKEKIPDIRLLTPNAIPKGIIETEHNSKWENIKDRNIDYLLTPKQISVLEELVVNNQWVIEESNNLIDMLKTRKSIF